MPEVQMELNNYARSMFCAYHLLTSRPLTAMRIQLERWIAEWTPQLGPHTSILLTAQHDLGPRTGHLQGPWVWQTLPRWFALIGAYGEGQNLILQITPWLLPNPPPLPPQQLVVQNLSDKILTKSTPFLEIWSIIIPLVRLVPPVASSTAGNSMWYCKLGQKPLSTLVLSTDDKAACILI